MMNALVEICPTAPAADNMIHSNEGPRRCEGASSTESADVGRGQDTSGLQDGAVSGLRNRKLPADREEIRSLE